MYINNQILEKKEHGNLHLHKVTGNLLSIQKQNWIW
jgi:hypothetical protein